MHVLHVMENFVMKNFVKHPNDNRHMMMRSKLGSNEFSLVGLGLGFNDFRVYGLGGKKEYGS